MLLLVPLGTIFYLLDKRLAIYRSGASLFMIGFRMTLVRSRYLFPYSCGSQTMPAITMHNGK